MTNILNYNVDNAQVTLTVFFYSEKKQATNPVRSLKIEIHH